MLIFCQIGDTYLPIVCFLALSSVGENLVPNQDDPSPQFAWQQPGLQLLSQAND